MFEKKEKVEDWLIKKEIKNYIINDDLTVDVFGDVDLSYKKYGDLKISELPVMFNDVSGEFDISEQQLTSFIGCPRKVGKSFSVFDNAITSFKNCPLFIGGNFMINGNNIRSFDDYNCKLGGSLFYDDNFNTDLNYKMFEKFEESFMLSMDDDGSHYKLNGEILNKLVLMQKLHIDLSDSPNMCKKNKI